MKHILLVNVFLLCFAFTEAQESKSSLLETTNLLTATLNDLSFERANVRATNSFIVFDSCNCELRTQLHWFSNDFWEYTRITFVLGDMLESSVEYQPKGDFFPYLLVKCDSGKFVRIVESSNKSTGTVTKKRTMVEIPVKVDANLSIEKVKNYFIRAIHLCADKD